MTTFSSQGSIASITVLPLSRQATVQIVSMLLRTKFLEASWGAHPWPMAPVAAQSQPAWSERAALGGTGREPANWSHGQSQGDE